MKSCILKPIVYNDNNYQKPSGYSGANSGFVAENGFGFEEWNNNPNMKWRGYRLFHTEPIANAMEFADGRLLMLMFANNHGQHAVGVAAGVYSSSIVGGTPSEEITFLRERHVDAWACNGVRKKWDNYSEFMELWEKHFQEASWMCPKDLYYWFHKPVQIAPKIFLDEGNLTNRYTQKMDVSREAVANFLHGNLPSSHAIWKWLADGDFTSSKRGGSTNLSKRNPLKKARKAARKGGGGAIGKETSYDVSGTRTIHPYHANLQAKYVRHLKQAGFNPKENKKHVDIQYHDKNGNLVYCEVKPTINVDSRYAIRFAVGQLLEYRFLHDNSAKLKIVINSKPAKKRELDFLKSLNIDIAYLNAKESRFIERSHS
nr:hypothetical protein [Pseudodesulfovibrio sp.]